ncbi:biliverdin-producing heme oxygenase [Flaviaesturariibacter terrae]
MHETLEARLQPQLESIGDAESYARLLRSFYAFYASLESRIAAALPAEALPDIASRRKADWLLDDLAALGHPSTDDMPMPAATAIDSAAAAWGALYVLEGSTLGGRIICRMLSAQLPGAPLRFFSGYGAHTGPSWIAFLAALEQAAPRLSYDAIRQSATLTFQSFDLWLQQQLPVLNKIA